MTDKDKDNIIDCPYSEGYYDLDYSYIDKVQERRDEVKKDKEVSLKFQQEKPETEEDLLREADEYIEESKETDGPNKVVMQPTTVQSILKGFFNDLRQLTGFSEISEIEGLISSEDLSFLRGLTEFKVGINKKQVGVMNRIMRRYVEKYVNTRGEYPGE